MEKSRYHFAPGDIVTSASHNAVFYTFPQVSNRYKYGQALIWFEKATPFIIASLTCASDPGCMIVISTTGELYQTHHIHMKIVKKL